MTRSYTATAAINVLANDLPGSAPLNPASVQLLGQTAGTTNVPGLGGGLFSVAATGVVSAVAPAFSGTSLSTSIGYTVQDQAGQTSNAAVLRLTFTNAVPLAADDAATTATNTSITIPVLSNDTDADGNATLLPASVTLGSAGGTNGGGTFTVRGGVVTFVPAGGFAGLTSTTYTVEDELGLVSVAATITVTVTNAAPVANRDVAATTAGTPVPVPVLNNDTDANGYATLVPGSVTLSPANGVTSGGTFVVDAATGVITFTPTFGSSGATIGYRVQDSQGAWSNSANLTVSITTVVADVQATLSGPATTPAGAWAELTLTLSNPSAVTATSVQGRVRLPAYLSQVTASHNAVYVPSTGLVTFASANLAAGSTRTHTIHVLMPAAGLVGAIASSSATSADPAPDNNDGTPAGSRTSTTPTQVADVAATLSGPATAPAGGTLRYRLLAVNYGPSTATGVALAAQLPAGLSGVTVTGGGSYDPISGLVSVPLLPTLAARSAASYGVTLPVPTTLGATLTARVAASTTTADGDPTLENHNGTSELASLATTIVEATAASAYCPGAATLDATTASGEQPNTYYPGLLTASGSTVTVGPALATTDAAPIQPGDLVLLMQMQGADIDYSNSPAYGDGLDSPGVPAGGFLAGSGFTAGQYELRYVALSSVTPAAGGVLTLASALDQRYTNIDATATAGQHRYQVVRVPRYRNLTLGADLAPPAWNGRTGGVLALDVAGTLDLAGYTLDARGRGFRGGGSYYQGGPGTGGATTTDFAAPYASTVHAPKGEGLAGTPRLVNHGGTLLNTGAEGYPGGCVGRGAPGNAGGGGTDGSVATNQNNTGGGGGANGGFGGAGGHAWFLDNPTGGHGGTPFLSAGPNRIVLGGGGGAGSSNNGTGGSGQAVLVNNGFNSSGAAGGGIVLVRAGQVAGPGTIDVSGLDVTLPVDNDGAGGGGAGGSAVLLSSGSLSSVTVLANGGAGGSDNLAVTAPHGPGGGGSAGVVFASGPLSAASQAQPGSNGLTGTTNGPEGFGAAPGTAFSPFWRTDVAADELPLPAACRPVPLPITLIEFNAVAQEPDAVLSWTTAQEINNLRFDVERSLDGRSFEVVGKVSGQGTSTSRRQYSFTDLGAALVASMVYYRLRQVDFDGTQLPSDVRVVRFATPDTPELAVYPNAATETLNVRLNGATGPSTVGIFTTTGVRVLQGQLADAARTAFDVRHLAAGTYLLQVKTKNGQTLMRRFVKY